MDAFTAKQVKLRVANSRYRPIFQRGVAGAWVAIQSPPICNGNGADGLVARRGLLRARSCEAAADQRSFPEPIDIKAPCRLTDQRLTLRRLDRRAIHQFGTPDGCEIYRQINNLVAIGVQHRSRGSGIRRLPPEVSNPHRWQPAYAGATSLR